MSRTPADVTNLTFFLTYDMLSVMEQLYCSDRVKHCSSVLMVVTRN